ncbi:sigma factor-like helix-turn-helix DNA-binding protein [Clostridium sp. FS41]|uniref:sigma factor-like helix-turn-helix DNA-binding protein n=1 Tax=Clostridium sp. FS41 TaxID=1609975 RepID=UPI0019105FF2|nr:sigma factor-like helix-turn-helix DNA-binding protein [Clostridium sp. FS41]
MKQATVSLQENGKQKVYSVNRLIAQAFIPNPENKPYVSYLDGNPANNHVDNLSWTTKDEQVAKAKRTLKKKKRSCSICGAPTLSDDGICTSCKQIEKMEEARKQNKINTLEEIRKEFKAVNPADLTYLQRQTVEMRLQGMTYEEIGSVMGCSRQCVDQRLKAVLERSEKIRTPGKCTRKAYMSAQNKLSKKRNLLMYLTGEEEITRMEIQELEQIIVKYEEMYPQEKKMDPSGSRREGSRTK